MSYGTTDEVAHVVVERSRALRSEVQTLRSATYAEFAEVGQRWSSIEAAVVGPWRELVAA